MEHRRRWNRGLVWLVAVVGLLFVVLAVPGSPVTALLAHLLAAPERVITISADGMSPSSPSRATRPVLRAAVGAMISPQRTYLQYRQLFELVAKELGRDLVFVQRETYSDINDLLVNGTVDVAWVCTGALSDLRRRNGARLLVVPVVNGESRYRSYVIARFDGPRDLEDLRGKEFAFTDPLSLTGRRVMIQWLASRGETAESFFGNVFYTHAHDNSIRAVRRRLADAACVDSLVYDGLQRLDPAAVEGTRVIWRSEWFPIPPLVVSAQVPPALRDELAALFLHLNAEPRAKPAMRAMGVERFVRPDPGVYSLYWPG
ncbi:MAG TPA: phosphate/phosphite/phosphonate ABC transporter substrate-binding protein [Acidobacteria bacterium]|nr:phosphate/phosphite/phosphonate ABC transporter substrate-binding protein [Acidobacteriota bacterium]